MLELNNCTYMCERYEVSTTTLTLLRCFSGPPPYFLACASPVRKQDARFVFLASASAFRVCPRCVSASGVRVRVRVHVR